MTKEDGLVDEMNHELCTKVQKQITAEVLTEIATSAVGLLATTKKTA